LPQWQQARHAKSSWDFSFHRYWQIIALHFMLRLSRLSPMLRNNHFTEESREFDRFLKCLEGSSSSGFHGFKPFFGSESIFVTVD